MHMGASVPDLVAALETRGFKHLGRDARRWLSFEGPLNTSAGQLACDFSVDPDFFELPIVKLKEIPASLRPIAPHIGGAGGICYLAANTVVIDIFDPLGQTLRCLEEAEHVLDRVLKNEMVEDLAEEFLVHWFSRYCYVDGADFQPGAVPAFCLISRQGTRIPVVTEDLDRASKRLDTIGAVTDREQIPAFIVNTTAIPRPLLGHWPPETVADLLSWQRALDARCAKKIQQRLTEAYQQSKKDAVIFIQSPQMSYGFHVHFDDSVLPEAKRRYARGTELLYSFRITRLAAVRIDASYIVQRNIPGQKTLAGKNIVIVGCGTIGGYLADLLVKAGAGLKGGQLTLVDFEMLLPQNIGRHRLGLPYAFFSKAEGMKIMLESESPGVQVRALSVDARQAHIGRPDILIDATGEEALGHWLTANYVATMPILSVWIEGPGTAVRALLKESPDGACYRCLSTYQQLGEFPTVKGGVPYIMAGHGCEGLYVPFPSTVSVQAAALGADMAAAWANRRNEATLKTRVIDSSFEIATADCNPPKIKDCPACSS